MAALPRALALLASLSVFASCGNRTPLTPFEASVPPDGGATSSLRDRPADSSERAGEEPQDDGGRSLAGDFSAPTRVIALSTWTPVHTAARRESSNHGYLRAGAIVDVLDGPHGREGCPTPRDHPEGGWYRIRGEGYVCVGGSMAQAYPFRGARAPRQPDLDASMPYPVAVNYGHTLMYRRPPTTQDLRDFEPWRFHHEPEDSGANQGTPHASGEDMDGGVTDTDATAPRRARRDAGPRDVAQVRLSELAGDRRGPLVRRMLTGMYVALDRTVADAEAGESYWRTQGGGFVRSARLSLLRWTPTFHGMVIDAEHHLPAAFMVSDTGWSYRVSTDGRSVRNNQRVSRMTGFWMSSEPEIRQGGQSYGRTVEGLALNLHHIRRASLRAPPAGVQATERWIDVDLDEQVLVAYEGPRAVYVTLLSSGRRDEHRPERDHPTPAGSFRIESKHISITMDGDTTAEGPYSIEDVPWVMYFHDSFAIHGAFWHNYFGWRMSHGCVNLSPTDARWMFLWTEPHVPQGWHGVYANLSDPGTRVELRHSRDDARDSDRPLGANVNVPH